VRINCRQVNKPNNRYSLCYFLLLRADTTEIRRAVVKARYGVTERHVTVSRVTADTCNGVTQYM